MVTFTQKGNVQKQVGYKSPAEKTAENKAGVSSTGAPAEVISIKSEAGTSTYIADTQGRPISNITNTPRSQLSQNVAAATDRLGVTEANNKQQYKTITVQRVGDATYTGTGENKKGSGAEKAYFDRGVYVGSTDPRTSTVKVPISTGFERRFNQEDITAEYQREEIEYREEERKQRKQQQTTTEEPKKKATFLDAPIFKGQKEKIAVLAPLAQNTINFFKGEFKNTLKEFPSKIQQRAADVKGVYKKEGYIKGTYKVGKYVVGEAYSLGKELVVPVMRGVEKGVTYPGTKLFNIAAPESAKRIVKATGMPAEPQTSRGDKDLQALGTATLIGAGAYYIPTITGSILTATTGYEFLKEPSVKGALQTGLSASIIPGVRRVAGEFKPNIAIDVFKKEASVKDATKKIFEIKQIAKERKVTEPKLPKVTGPQSKVIETVKKRGDTVGGSYSLETFYKEARTHKDIDVISKTTEATAKAIQKNIAGSTIKRGETSIKIMKEGKTIADVVPAKVGVKGYELVEGLRVAKPENVLASKLQQIQFTKGKGYAKAVKDINKITGIRLTQAEANAFKQKPEPYSFSIGNYGVKIKVEEPIIISRLKGIPVFDLSEISNPRTIAGLKKGNKARYGIGTGPKSTVGARNLSQLMSRFNIGKSQSRYLGAVLKKANINLKGIKSAGFHAASGRAKGSYVIGSKSEQGGLFISPEFLATYLKTGKGQGGLRFSIGSTSATPTGYFTLFKGRARLIPKKSIREINRPYATERGTRGTKNEPEAIVEPMSRYKDTGVFALIKTDKGTIPFRKLVFEKPGSKPLTAAELAQQKNSNKRIQEQQRAAQKLVGSSSSRSNVIKPIDISRTVVYTSSSKQPRQSISISSSRISLSRSMSKSTSPSRSISPSTSTSASKSLSNSMSRSISRSRSIYKPSTTYRTTLLRIPPMQRAKINQGRAGRYSEGKYKTPSYKQVLYGLNKGNIIKLSQPKNRKRMVI